MADTPRHDLPASASPAFGSFLAQGYAWEPAERRTSLFGVLSLLLRHLTVILATPFIAGVSAIVFVLVVPPKFTAVTTFTPEKTAEGLNLPGIAGLAAEFGVGIPGMDNSARFYAEVLESRRIRDSVLLTPFADPRADATEGRLPLLDILETAGKAPGEQLENGREALESIVSIGVNATTNIVGISVKTRYPELSAAVAARYLELLNQFNSQVRETSGRNKRQFAENRLAQAEAELRLAEEATAQFLLRNRRFERSPELANEYARLQREARIREDVLTTLRREYEQARIQEVNDTPLITVIDPATVPGKKSHPRRTLTVILMTILGAILGVFAAFVFEYVRQARLEDNPDLRELSGVLTGMSDRLRRLAGRTP